MFIIQYSNKYLFYCLIKYLNFNSIIKETIINFNKTNFTNKKITI